MSVDAAGRRSFVRMVLVLVAGFVVVVGSAFVEGGPDDPYPRGKRGYDVSFPQCGDALPVRFDFGIVGITGGRSFTQNPCLAEQFAWAESAALPAGLYVNLMAPVG